VDSTYYFPPTERNAQLWASRTPDDFTFNIKAFSLLTQHPTRRKALPQEVALPDKERIYPKDVDAKDLERVWDEFLSALEPLGGKLGAFLFQFPPWFPIGRRNRDYILECAKRAAPVPIAVEFRNKTWMSDENQKDTLEFLEGHGISYVCVDMPQGFVSSIPPVVAATADLAMVRFHGRNSEEWESGEVQRRFRYLYTDKELDEWAPRIEKLSQDAKRTHVLMNNCYRDYAQRNATELVELLRN
jgi:uncharacterized protein YecE (DUF72 family)